MVYSYKRIKKMLNLHEDKGDIYMTTAKKHDQGKPDLSQVPGSFSRAAARAFMFGEKKYGRNNWRSGFKITRILAALERHLQEFKDGKDKDEESGLNITDHLAACLAMLIETYENLDSGLDDRYKESDFKAHNLKKDADGFIILVDYALEYIQYRYKGESCSRDTFVNLIKEHPWHFPPVYLQQRVKGWERPQGMWQYLTAGHVQYIKESLLTVANEPNLLLKLEKKYLNNEDKEDNDHAELKKIMDENRGIDIGHVDGDNWPNGKPRN